MVEGHLCPWYKILRGCTQDTTSVRGIYHQRRNTGRTTMEAKARDGPLVRELSTHKIRRHFSWYKMYANLSPVGSARLMCGIDVMMAPGAFWFHARAAKQPKQQQQQQRAASAHFRISKVDTSCAPIHASTATTCSIALYLTSSPLPLLALSYR